MSQPAEMHSRVHKHKFKAKQEEAAVFTLDEWERTKGMKLKPMMTGEKQDTSRDEELARQLQNQLDLENFNASTGHSEAEQIRRSMFSFGGAEERKNDGRGSFIRHFKLMALQTTKWPMLYVESGLSPVCHSAVQKCQKKWIMRNSLACHVSIGISSALEYSDDYLMTSVAYLPYQLYVTLI
ncbi:ADP,ATP carrier protein 1 [Musa troglodytarum]|uniref:ADP,ATP carrier protein 1 n=1 Tax=Musa troglodytarum TaxID=320322 RepID=A0A9E7JN39_9LILI|nr:ADP,ATP carrier protein 1 [Musa troglodytarum]